MYDMMKPGMLLFCCPSSMSVQSCPAHAFAIADREICNKYVCLCHCSGEANGTAYVQFETVAMAKDAYERYNDVALDGKPMKIAFDNGNTQRLTSGIT